jgi:DNA-binding XRE family transcriptional regulator
MRIKIKQGVLYSLCKQEGISRDELARRVGVNRATAYRIDEGMADPSPKFIAGLIHVSGKKFEDLFDIAAAA